MTTWGPKGSREQHRGAAWPLYWSLPRAPRTMRITASTVQEYLQKLPADRRRTIEAVRDVILKNIDTRFVEGVQGGAISYYVPHSVFPAGYHCDPEQPLPFAAIAAQKNHIGLYLFCVYSDPKQEA